MSDIPSRDALIEAGARALCDAHGADWDYVLSIEGHPFAAACRIDAAAILDAILPLVLAGAGEALGRVANAEALAGVRDLVAGWNGENQPDGPYTERHPPRLGATLPKTDCGAVYALDEALVNARAVLAQINTLIGEIKGTDTDTKGAADER
jgi:hypothetical protein